MKTKKTRSRALTHKEVAKKKAKSRVRDLIARESRRRNRQG